MEENESLHRHALNLEQALTDAKQRLHHLEQALAEAKQRIVELERARPGATNDELAVPISEFEETLRRLVHRTAMIVQAEKCVIMVRDRDSGDLIARSPAFGMPDEDVISFRVHADSGISGTVFRTGKPGIFRTLEEIPATSTSLFNRLRLRNGVTVPLTIEKRDDQNHIVDRVNIGVLHCFNKRYNGEFIQEDVTLLERLSRNAAAVIANAQMFQDLVEEKQKLVHTLESLTAGLILVNQHGRVAQINAQARAMFDVADDINPISRPLSEVVRNDECRAMIERKIAEVQRIDQLGCATPTTEDTARGPDEIVLTDRDDQQFIYQVHAAYVHDDSGVAIGTVFIFNDVTDIRNLEQMKTEFVSIVSHELRTPLTPMKGFVRTLLDDENEDWYTHEDRREFYTIIDQNVDRLSRMINDLLNVSRIEKGAGLEMDFQPTDLRKATEAVIDTQRGQIKDHTIVIDFDPETIVAEVDADKYQNILQNLVSNAIKYSPNGGEIKLIGRIDPASEDCPELICIGVKDQGAGMSEAQLKKFGELFYRTGNKEIRKVGGTGIGVYLVKNLVLMHHGQFWAESEMGVGTTVWFRLPIHQLQSEEANDTQNVIEAP